MQTARYKANSLSCSGGIDSSIIYRLIRSLCPSGAHSYHFEQEVVMSQELQRAVKEMSIYKGHCYQENTYIGRLY